jgi:hypothetical protein
MTWFRIFIVRENPEALSPKAKKKGLFGCLRAASHPSGMLRDRPQTPHTPIL